MDTLYFMLAQAESTTSEAGKTASGFSLSNPWVMTVVMVGFIAFFWFVIVRPQNKKKKQHEQMMSAIGKGDKVISIGGIHGKVISVKDGEIVVRIGANSEVTFDKSAISRVVNGKTADNKKSDKKNSKEIEDKVEVK